MLGLGLGPIGLGLGLEPSGLGLGPTGLGLGLSGLDYITDHSTEHNEIDCRKVTSLTFSCGRQPV